MRFIMVYMLLGGFVGFLYGMEEPKVHSSIDEREAKEKEYVWALKHRKQLYYDMQATEYADVVRDAIGTTCGMVIGWLMGRSRGLVMGYLVGSTGASAQTMYYRHKAHADKSLSYNKQSLLTWKNLKARYDCRNPSHRCNVCATCQLQQAEAAYKEIDGDFRAG